MADDELDAFARALMTIVRDPTIAESDWLLLHASAGTNQTSPSVRRWTRAVRTDDPRAALEALIPDIVDGVLFHLLDAIDGGQLPLSWIGGDGKAVPLQELGKWEMAGWLVGEEDSWIQRFSSERVTDWQV